MGAILGGSQRLCERCVFGGVTEEMEKHMNILKGTKGKYRNTTEEKILGKRGSIRRTWGKLKDVLEEGEVYYQG